jgi:hypothetical protein
MKHGLSAESAENNGAANLERGSTLTIDCKILYMESDKKWMNFMSQMYPNAFKKNM